MAYTWNLLKKKTQKQNYIDVETNLWLSGGMWGDKLGDWDGHIHTTI